MPSAAPIPTNISTGALRLRVVRAEPVTRRSPHAAEVPHTNAPTSTTRLPARSLPVGARPVLATGRISEAMLRRPSRTLQRMLPRRKTVREPPAPEPEAGGPPAFASSVVPLSAIPTVLPSAIPTALAGLPVAQSVQIKTPSRPSSLNQNLEGNSLLHLWHFTAPPQVLTSRLKQADRSVSPIYTNPDARNRITDSDPLEFRLAVLFEFRQANNSPG